MTVEIQFRIGSENPGPSHDQATDLGDGDIVGVKRAGITLPYSELAQWIGNGTVPPTFLANQGVLTPKEIAWWNRFRARAAYWTDPSLDHAQASAITGLDLEEVNEKVADWENRKAKLQALGYLPTSWLSIAWQYTHGVLIVDATLDQAVEWLERPLDATVHPALEVEPNWARAGWNINYHLLSPFPIYADLLDPAVAVPPFGHPTQDRPFTVAEVVSAVTRD